MSAASYDIVAERYTAYHQEFVYKDSAGVVVNVTGMTARMQVRPRMGSDIVLLELTDEDGITLGAGGSVVLDIVTDGLDFRSAVYDILLDGERWLEGDFRVKPGVTHV